MALAFNQKPTAVIKAKQFDSTAMHTFGGVTSGNTTPENAAAQINKLFALAGLSVVADVNTMTRDFREEVVDNG